MESDQRGATAERVGLVRVIAVSIHAPLRGATPRLMLVERALPLFQSTRPSGARHLTESRIFNLPWFQSTRPCGARRDRVPKHNCETDVSIHAPLRGATSSAKPSRTRVHGFNPRAPAGRDCKNGISSYEVGRVSIHAPLRGATSPCPFCARLKLFQSTRPCGARLLRFDNDSYHFHYPPTN
jgi:hypothetical protein